MGRVGGKYCWVIGFGALRMGHRVGHRMGHTVWDISKGHHKDDPYGWSSVKWFRLLGFF